MFVYINKTIVIGCHHTKVVYLDYVSYFLLHFAGIIADPGQSLFTYGADGSWGTFYRPDYIPAFGVEFSDPELEEEARATCGDDDLCLFDIAATGDIRIGAATKESGEEQETITELFTTSKFIFSLDLAV